MFAAGVYDDSVAVPGEHGRNVLSLGLLAFAVNFTEVCMSWNQLCGNL